MNARRAAIIIVLAAACSDPPVTPKLNKQVGESCAVSTECAAGLRCLEETCQNGTCSASTDCRGEPPDGCATWACVAGICESGCLPDSGGFPDATMTFPDAEPAETGPMDTGMSDTGQPDMDSGVPPDDTGVPPDDSGTPPDDGGMPGDTGVPPDGGSPPDAGGCDPTARAPVAGDLMINEILADPGDDLATGDANNDGTRDQADDEFVELANISSSTLELSGVRIFDAIALRHTFGARTLSCGQVIVVFGGGSTMHMNWRPNWVVASTGSLLLNNSNEQVRVGTSTATPANLTSESYSSGASNQAMVRTNELVPGSPFIDHLAHPQAMGRSFSPGTRVDGTAF